MRRTLIIIFVGILGAAFCGCAKRPTDEKVLARVGNKSVTLKEFKRKLSKLPAYYHDIVDRNKKRFLDEIIIEMLFYEEAVRNGIDRDRELREVIEKARKKIIIAKLIKNQVEDKIELKEDEVRAFYEAHKNEFKTPELWRASHILVATEEEARDLLGEISKGVSFEELAKTRSMDATATRGGDVGYFRRGQLVPDFEEACLALKVGGLSGVVHTQFGYHIIKLTDKKEPTVEGFERVRQGIEEELKKRKRSELFDKLVLRLKEKYNVDIEEDVFKSLEAIGEEKSTSD